MSEEKPIIQFALRNISTLQFAIIENSFSQNEPIKLDYQLNYSSIDEQMILVTHFKILFKVDDNPPFIILEMSMSFQVKKETWSLLYDVNSNEVKLEYGFALHLAVLTISTARGILHSNTNGSPFNHFIIPLIDAKKVLKNDEGFYIVKNKIEI